VRRHQADHAEQREEVQLHQAAHFRSGASQDGMYKPTPALLIRMSIAPNRSSVRSTTRRRDAFLGQIAGRDQRLPARGAAQSFFGARAQGELRAGARKLRGACRSDARRSAGDERDFAVDSWPHALGKLEVRLHRRRKSGVHGSSLNLI
jgi:hypothetical protein